ncbi:IS5 family transposase [Mesorhizobium sp. B2-1-8]|uniref:IS5 family transposase n=1 Tax=Mesorhizobium sp. B2-1-8 TaxID=2589967 RepID=UPI001D12A51D|nr:IS5 family transposase [Mesorhizobium sp. B2-1-8]UCI18101.1 IS5 family transposase [Mesorhizobium sp. B2-1-8]UCI18370.1 IS5 family transposase [Mesorhizobium sp. B2-1-8]UCI18574.1 IS5 family transposase [Mesorhizobium sp. B2-1-8]UCI19550.1 IS5 family transposase [Mesorhizobium sp. B2-1-8]UCI19672.1 IS5 family transposase [Mesorhizobium sp. B2-1-8]
MSRPREKRETGEQDLFRSRLDQIINMKHELVRLAQAIDWPVLEERFGAVYSDGPGMPPLPTRLMAGLAILKHTFDLSDEELCARWVENPYFQYLCGEEFFRHELSFERSSMTRWRQRMGEEPITALLQESLAVAVKSGAMKPADTRRVIVDTTVQPKNVMFPTDAKLVNRARERLVRLAKKAGLDLRQTYVRVGKLALIKHQRYAHAKQFKRANKALRKLKTYLGRTIRDISRRITGQTDLEASFKWPLYQASAVLEQRQRQRGRKIYSLHAHEVECIGKGKAHAPYEFGVKVSIATTLERSKGGQFALHAKALPGNPYDGHTLATVIPDMEKTIGNEIGRILADAGYRGHNAPESHKLRVFTAGQKRRVTPAIKRQMRRRSAVEPVIGHIKAEHRMGRNYLAGEQGDAINAILAAAGYNFSLLIKWFRLLLWLLITALQSRPRSSAA